MAVATTFHHQFLLYLLTAALTTFRFCDCANSSPNIIIIYPDNQDLLLGSNNRTFMPILNSNIIDKGVTLTNGFVSTPICCPSRAELLTGRYFHNIGPPYPPNGTCMHVDPYFPIFNTFSLFQTLHKHGYKTGAFGKIVNDMPFWCNTSNPQTPMVEGFDRLYIPCNYLDYYGHTYLDKYDNGSYSYVLTNTSYQSPSMYETSQIGNATINWINQMMMMTASSVKNTSQLTETELESDAVGAVGTVGTVGAPFFILWGVHAPHYPATPAYWYQDRFNDSNKYKAPRTINFNQHYPNRHWLVDVEPKLDDTALEFVDQLYRNRLRAMLSVDDFIYDLDKVLNYWNIYNNTYVFFVSDNGYHLGQWRIPCDMRNIYDTDIRVPFYIRGPNIKGKSEIHKMISNVDIAATIYDLTGIINQLDQNQTSQIDGRSFARFLNCSKNVPSKNNSNNVGNTKGHNSNADVAQNRLNFDDSDNDNDNDDQDKVGGDSNSDSDGESDSEWRDMLLFEFIWANNHTFGGYNIWFPSNESFMGENKHPPTNDVNGNVYWTDNSHGSSFRGLRILNQTMNVAYAEYVNGDWTQEDLNNPIWFEMYNLTNDPYQTNNIYNQTSNWILDYLHQTLINYATCKGTQCP